MLEITVAGGVPVIIKGEPRFAIIAFLLATLWEFVHIEWMTHCHHKNLSHAEEAEKNGVQQGDVLDSLRFRTSCCGSVHNSVACRGPGCLRAGMWLLLCLSIGLFLTGATFENIRFTSFLAGESEGCVRSYSLYTLGMELVSDFSLQSNGAKPYVWILFLAYMILLAVLPLFVHMVQVLVCILSVNEKKLCQAADMCWTFASVDVFLVGLYLVQVSKLAVVGANFSLASTNIFSRYL